MTAEERARAREMLDLEEGLGDVPVLHAPAAQALLLAARRIAIVGASAKPSRPSYGVMSYLQAEGFECVPVNPVFDEVLGVRCYPTLEDAVAETGAPDIVDVFRRAEHTPAVARSAVATGAGALWLQLGIVNWEAARIAHEGGLSVVMDRCTRIEHERAAR